MVGRLLALAAGLTVFFMYWSARASPIYPQTIKDHLMTSCDPPLCTICHRDLQGGLGTVTRKFGQNMQALGLVPEDPASLISALDQAKAMNLDSDGDGDTDIDALRACRDPNVAPGANVPPLQYGCAVAREPIETVFPAAGLLLGLSVVVAGVRRRRVGR
jgi:hypothetical protein